MITLLLPTAKRPDLLKIALRSVSAQTARSEIAEVIVSESAGDARSGAVCQEFPELPIRYILREPQIQMAEHFSVLKKATWSGEYTVMLHDDDWWTPEFLQKSLEAFQAHPQAVSYCCDSYHVQDEEGLLMPYNMSFFFWVGANFPKLQTVWELTPEEVLLACLIYTPAHYSTILARAEAFRSSAIIYDTGNTWDLDRMFIFELSRHGPMLYSPIAQAYYRFHGHQLTNAFTEANRSRQMERTTEWMIERSGQTPSALAELLYARASQCPRSARTSLQQKLMDSWVVPTLARKLEASAPIVKLHQKIRRKARTKKWIKPFFPPVLWNARSTFREAFKK